MCIRDRYEKDGMHLEDVLMHVIRVKFIRPAVRKYETENYYESDPDGEDQKTMRKEEMCIRDRLSTAASFEDFSSLLLREGVTVKESRGRLSYLTPDRTKPITCLLYTSRCV